jgi:hypothetical protein
MIGTYTRDERGRLRVTPSTLPYRTPTPPPPPAPAIAQQQTHQQLPDGVGAHLLGKAAGVAAIGAKVAGQADAARERIAHRGAAATAADRRRLIASLDGARPESPAVGQAPDRLRTAVVQGDSSVVKSLVRDTRSANALYSSPQGVSLLFAAAQAGHAAVLQHLLDNGARPDGVQHDGCTPLFAAARHGHSDAVELLASSSEAEVNRPNYAGELPVHVAAENGHRDALAVLVAHQAWLDRPSPATGKTALFAAADACSTAAVEVLADAILRTHSFVALWMLRHPWEDRSAEPVRSWSALELCEARGEDWLPVVKLLHAAEASGTVGAQQRLAWAKVAQELLPPPPDDSGLEDGITVHETPTMMALRRREERLRQQQIDRGTHRPADRVASTRAQQQQPRSHNGVLAGFIGRAIGLQPTCAVAARCIAQHCDETSKHATWLATAATAQRARAKLKQTTGSMESLSTMAHQRTAATTNETGSSRACTHASDVAVVAAQVEGARQSMVTTRKFTDVQTHEQGVAASTDDTDGAVEDEGT